MKLDLEPSFENEGKTYRTYDEAAEDPVQLRVRNHYYNQHRLQTVDFVKSMHKKWLKFSHAKMPILECLDILSSFLDESDPDVDEANLFHAYQTAERIRKAHPDKPWMHLAGLVHDLGKVMSVWGEEQWAVTGDTVSTGTPIWRTIGTTPKNGIYEKNCGIDNLLMTWSHDEYMYQVLKNHGSTLPEEALYAIRFHSFYPYHSHGGYKQFESLENEKMKPAIMMLNDCDLYSKNDETPNIENLKPYYQSLVDQYIPGDVAW
ncbi:unnamed protein product [Caenorhabditis auriculariae]|uniref:Inositol oxygenase n=1 Tax=Caenorhabditis auriculariae TaxID=2777116 RepID=A0A8S1HNE8_9PELO|nr:unnamed protein product [Caenorhabditis auriculariae]